MNFDCGYSGSQQSVPDGNTRMGIGGRVDQDSIELSRCVLDHLDQFPFEVALFAFHFHIQRTGEFFQHPIDRIECVPSIVLLFALSEKIEIGAMQYEYFQRVYPIGVGFFLTSS